jgi:hypothetical protein
LRFRSAEVEAQGRDFRVRRLRNRQKFGSKGADNQGRDLEVKTWRTRVEI